MQTRTMLSVLFSILVSILFAMLATSCSGGAQHPVAATPAASRPAPPPPDAHDTAVADLVGVWQGKALGTPFGDFPFAITFDREPTGDVHGRLQGKPGMYLDFRFHREPTRWVLIEEGAIPEIGKQNETLAPVPGTPVLWTDGNPAHLAVALAVTADALEWTTTIDGKPHAVFKMARARGEAAEQIRQAIARLTSVK